MKKLFTFFLIAITFYSNAQWVQLPFEQENLESLYFKDANTGYVGTFSTDETLPKLFKTSDGGMNWNEIPLPDIGNYTKITTIHFFDGNTGFLTTDDQYTSLRTTDGGENWTSIFCGIEEYPGKAYFKDDGTGFYYADIIENNLFYTEDWGTTWSFKGDYYLIHDIQFPNNQGDIGYMHTEWATYKTTDNGDTWNGISSFWEGSGNIFFYNENIGFLGTQGGIYKTSNGGESWNNIFFYPNVKIFFLTENIGFNISSFYTPPVSIPHRVYKTLDGGETWQEMYKNDDTEIMENTKYFCFPNNTTGYAITNNHVYKLDVTAGVEDVTKNTITVYPVPSTSILNINNISTLLNSKYQIVDMTGKIVATGTVTTNEITIDKLSKGMYLLKIDEREAIKFIKE